ncbi:MAG: PAT family beta-lactamase induction signal transducer AmpG [Gammaproteobacteria bacterium]|jgi:PAT family beta-lactamase induction signal transducer AmpG
MSNQEVHPKSRSTLWLEAISYRPVVAMLFLGFSAGIPILLIFSSLSLWLREAGVERSAVTFFSWAALGYSFKFVWAPLVDQLPLPFLTNLLGRRRSWILLSQFLIMLSIVAMAITDPADGLSSLTAMAWFAVLLGFSSATQDIVIDAYRIEAASPEWQGMMSSTYIAGYRIAMIIAGAGSLYLASGFGSTAAEYQYSAWRLTYLIMAGMMFVGVLTTLLVSEPERNQSRDYPFAHTDYIRFLMAFLMAVLTFIAIFIVSRGLGLSLDSLFENSFWNQPLGGFLVELIRLFISAAGASVTAYLLVKFDWLNRDMVKQSYVLPIQDFFGRYGFKVAILLLMLIGSYRISDIVLGIISNVFYQDLGFSKVQIADVVKVFGVIMTIVGSFVGGLMALRYGVLRILFLGAVLSALTNLLFLLLTVTGNNLTWLVVVISADNLSAGLASAAFVAFLSSLTNVSFTAMQFAIFTSMMTLLPKVLGGYSGSMVESIGYPGFFVMTTLMGIPVLVLIAVTGRYCQLGKFELNSK